MSEESAAMAGQFEEQPFDEFSERDWEALALDQLAEFGWQHFPGKELNPSSGHRKDWGDLVLYPRLRAAIVTRHPQLPSHAVEEAITELLRQAPGSDVRKNWDFYKKLTGDLKVSYTDPLTDKKRSLTVRPIDFADPHGNDLVASSQVRIRAASERAFVFDIILYVNGLPLCVVELKKASGPDDSRTAYDQIQNYRRELKSNGTFRTLFLAVTTDGVTARLGTPFTPWEHMAPWHAEDGVLLKKKEEREDGRALERMIAGALEPDHFLSQIAGFLSYSAEGTGGSVDTVKLAKAHQYIAVNTALAATTSAATTDGRAGVIWHTQGAGKSEEMLFYTGKVSGLTGLPLPTVVLITDRIDLDTQLLDTFNASHSLHRAIGGLPEKAHNSGQLKELLTRGEGSGGSSSPRSKNSASVRRRRPRAPGIRCYRTAGTSSSSSMRRTVATTTLRTVSPAICETRSPRHVHRLHRHPDRQPDGQHPRGLRADDPHLRPHAGRQRRGNRPRLLRADPPQGETP